MKASAALFLDRVRIIPLIFIFFVTAFYFGGAQGMSLFISRALILCLFCLSSFSPSFLRLSASEWQVIQMPLAGFFLFLVYLVFQAWGGHAVFLHGIGSVYVYETTHSAIQLFVYLIFFLVCLDFFSSYKRILLVVHFFAFQIVCLISWAYYLKINHLVGGTHAHPDPLQFFAGNSNNFGGVLAMTTPFFLGVVAYHQRMMRKPFLNDTLIEMLFYLVLTGIVSAAIFHFEARTVFILQLFVLACFLLSNLKDRMMVQLLFACVIVFFLVLGLNSVSLPASFLKAYQNLPKELGHLFGVNSSALRILFQYPWFGTGLGTFIWVARGYQTVNPEMQFYTNSYNSYLDLLSETGLVGFTLFFVPFIIFVLGVFKYPLDPEADAESHSLRSSSLLAIFIAVLLALFNDYVKLPAIALLLTLHLALAVKAIGLAEHPLKRVIAVSEFIGPHRRTALVLIILVFTAVLWHSDRELRFRMLLNQSGSLLSHGLSLEAEKPRLTELEKATHLIPSNAESWSLLGRAYAEKAAISSDAYARQTLTRRSIASYEMSTKILPTWPDTWFHLGRTKIAAGFIDEGLECLEKGAGLAPHNRDALLYVVAAYLQVADETGLAAKKGFYKQRAIDLMKKTSQFERPFSAQDFDYINNYDYVNGRPHTLDEQDKKRIEAILAPSKRLLP